MQPKISVLMPVYNAGLYLDEAINSILNQTFESFEFIIIDDGSTDNSIDVLERYAKNDPRVKIIKRGNRGISETRNELIGYAQAKYIAWMDADDVSMPERLASQYSYLSQHTGVVAIGVSTLLIDPDGENLCDWISPKTHEEIDATHMSGRGGAIVFPSSMMTKDAVSSVGGFSNTLVAAEDLDLFLKLAEIGRLVNIAPLLFHYRQHEKSISHMARKRVAEDTNVALRSAYIRRGLEYSNVIVLSSKQTIGEIYSKWAWWALMYGNIKTARKYAFRVLLRAPHQVNTWKLLACALRGH